MRAPDAWPACCVVGAHDRVRSTEPNDVNGAARPSEQQAVKRFADATATKRFPSRCASAIQIVLPVAIHRRDVAQAPTAFLEIVSDDFPVSFHGCFSSQSFWKAGSERKESHCGWSLKSAGVRQLLYGICKRCCSLGIALSLSPTKCSTNAKFSSPLGPSTASFPLGSSVIARSASFIAASFSPSTA